MSTFDDFAVEQLAARDKLIASLRADVERQRVLIRIQARTLERQALNVQRLEKELASLRREYNRTLI